MGLPSDPVTVFDVRPAWRRLRIGSTVAPLHLRGFTVLRALQSPGWAHLWKVPCFGQPQLASAYNMVNMVANNWWRYHLQHLDVKMLDVGQCQLRMANLRAEMILQSVRNLGYFELGNSAKDLDSWRALALPNVSPSGIIRCPRNHRALRNSCDFKAASKSELWTSSCILMLRPCDDVRNRTLQGQLQHDLQLLRCGLPWR